MADAQGGPYWSLPADKLLASLQSSATGLSGQEAAARLRRGGRNEVTPQGRSPAILIFLRQLRSPLVLILAFAGVMSGVLAEWVDASIILAILLGSTVLGFIQENNASNAVAKLRQQLALTAKVRRDGAVKQVPVTEIVPGDIVLLSAGVVVPADAVLLSVNSLMISEAALTGESFPTEKTAGVKPAETPLAERDNCVFLGTSVRSGSGEALVVATGRATEFGEVADRLKQKPQETEFARGVRRFGLLLIRVMIVVVLAVLVINQVLHRPFIDSLLFSVALGLGMSPELLPAIISVTLSAGATRLAKEGVIVRQLEAIENLGGMTVFCTDKTGTLTEGKIALVDALDALGQPSPRVKQLAYLNAAFETGIENPLDEAITEAGRAQGLTTGGYSRTDEIPYDFNRKRLSIAVAGVGIDRGQKELITKGAFESVVPLCATMAAQAGEVPLDAAALAEVRAFYAAKGGQGLRVLAVATRRLPDHKVCQVADETQMRLEGLLLFLDPPKPEAKLAIERLAAMNVAIKVISGDNQHVVRHLASQVGLTDVELMTGPQLAKLHDGAALWARADRTTLFAEVDPQQKEAIIRALQRVGHSVGYMGDGINDAPALYAADVGVSVDQAVDVARESADVVLTSRDLGVLCTGVEGGRRTFANTLKYIGITTSANFGNMISMAIAAPILPFLPMTAEQILLNNFLSDLPAITISTDSVDEARLKSAQSFSIGDIQRFMIVFGLISSAFDLITFYVLFRLGDEQQPIFQTAWFVVSLLTEVVVLFSLRTQGPLWKSRPGALLALSALAVAVFACLTPYLGPVSRLFGLVPLPPSMLAALIGISLAYVVATEIGKLIFYRPRKAPRRRNHLKRRKQKAAAA